LGRICTKKKEREKIRKCGRRKGERRKKKTTEKKGKKKSIDEDEDDEDDNDDNDDGDDGDGDGDGDGDVDDDGDDDVDDDVDVDLLLEGVEDKNSKFAKIISCALGSMYDTIAIKIYDAIPRITGTKKRVLIHPNLVLFREFGMKGLNEFCSQKIQPLPDFRKRSPLHIWEIHCVKVYSTLMRHWGVQNPPTFKILSRKKTRPDKAATVEEASFIFTDKKHPITIFFSQNTGVLRVEFFWQIANCEGFSWNSFKE
jgi:hypothetical protein